jgi:hypothetical protein
MEMTTKRCKDAACCRSSCSNTAREDLSCLPHGMLTTHADVINQDLLAFIRKNRVQDNKIAPRKMMKMEMANGD